MKGASAAAARAAERAAVEERKRNQSYQILSESDDEQEVVPVKVWNIHMYNTVPNDWASKINAFHKLRKVTWGPRGKIPKNLI